MRFLEYHHATSEPVHSRRHARLSGANLRANEFPGAPPNIEDLVYPDPAVWQWLFAQHR